jgi:hypothetical protein
LEQGEGKGGGKSERRKDPEKVRGTGRKTIDDSRKAPNLLKGTLYTGQGTKRDTGWSKPKQGVPGRPFRLVERYCPLLGGIGIIGAISSSIIRNSRQLARRD